jgi:hypothetical protein
MITIFISSLLCPESRGTPALHHQDELQGAVVTRPTVNSGLICTTYTGGPARPHQRKWSKPMKIGTLLTAAIVSLSAVGGGLAVYVAASKYQTMEKVSVAQSRLEVVRAVGDIPRYMNSERGFATNILYGPPAVDPAIRKELNEKVRKNTDGARDKMNAVRKNLSGSLDDATAIGTGIDDLNVKFNALREAMDKAMQLKTGKQCKYCVGCSCPAIRAEQKLMEMTLTPEILATIKRTPDDAQLADFVIIGSRLEHAATKSTSPAPTRSSTTVTASS